MSAKIIPIEYKNVEVFNGTEKDLKSRVRFLVGFDRFFCIAIFCSLIFAYYALVHYDIFASLFWNRAFTVVIFLCLGFLIFASLSEKTFQNIQRIKNFTFIVDTVEVVENGGMFVDGYKAEDVDRKFKYRFFFETAFDFSYDYFSLYQVNLNGQENFYYCRKRVK